jgi:hypothetical protein
VRSPPLAGSAREAFFWRGTGMGIGLASFPPPEGGGATFGAPSDEDTSGTRA